jgi:hypothetical protein
MSAAFFAAARVRKCVVPSGVSEVREAGIGVASGASALAVMYSRFIVSTPVLFRSVRGTAGYGDPSRRPHGHHYARLATSNVKVITGSQ